MHQTVGNVLRTLYYSNPPRTFKGAPGALVFGRGMFLDVPLLAAWQATQLIGEQSPMNALERPTREKGPKYDYIQCQKVLKSTQHLTNCAYVRKSLI